MSLSTSLALQDSALVLIDMANDFVYAGGVIADAGGPDYQARAQSILPALCQLVQRAREVGVLVVYVTDAHTPEDQELVKWPPHSMVGSWNAEIVPALAPQAGDLIVTKQTYSPFVHTEIEVQLRSRGIHRLYVAGLHTDCCCRHFSGDAFQRGFDLIWVTDAMQAFTSEAHEEGLRYFAAWYATDAEQQLTTAPRVLADWSGEGSASAT